MLWLASAGCSGSEDGRNGAGSGGTTLAGSGGQGGSGTGGTGNVTAGTGAGTSGGTGNVTAGTGAGTSGGTGNATAGTGGTGGVLPAFDPRCATGDCNNVGPGSLCDRLSTIQCAGEEHCCSNAGRDFATCKQVMQQGCDEQLLFDAIAENPKSGFDPVHAQLAFGEIERRASVCDPSVAEFGDSVDGLRGMFKGTKAPDSSCITLNALDRAEAATALASCLDPANNHCLPESTLSWACRAHADVGGHCFSDVNCLPGLFCDNPDLSIRGDECKPRKAVGSPCGLPNECESLFCKGGLCVEATVDAAYCLAQ